MFLLLQLSMLLLWLNIRIRRESFSWPSGCTTSQLKSSSLFFFLSSFLHLLLSRWKSMWNNLSTHYTRGRKLLPTQLVYPSFTSLRTFVLVQNWIEICFVVISFFCCCYCYCSSDECAGIYTYIEEVKKNYLKKKITNQ